MVKTHCIVLQAVWDVGGIDCCKTNKPSRLVLDMYLQRRSSFDVSDLIGFDISCEALTVEM